jgi:ABC-type antimicrobial peptide transport system permease subunit
MIYYPVRQRYRPAALLVVRGDAAAGRTTDAMLATLRDVDPALSLDLPQRLEAYTAIGILPQRIGAIITASLGVIALLLSAIGVYGVIAYMVSQRTREIGIRVALGAQRSGVVLMVLVDAAWTTLLGSAAGIAAGLYLSRFLETLLFEVTPFGFWSLTLPLATIFATALLASALPALRASRVDPAVALRHE